jgi:hypothetical protein
LIQSEQGCNQGAGRLTLTSSLELNTGKTEIKSQAHPDVFAQVQYRLALDWRVNSEVVDGFKSACPVINLRYIQATQVADGG